MASKSNSKAKNMDTSDSTSLVDDLYDINKHATDTHDSVYIEKRYFLKEPPQLSHLSREACFQFLVDYDYYSKQRCADGVKVVSLIECIDCKLFDALKLRQPKNLPMTNPFVHSCPLRVRLVILMKLFVSFLKFTWTCLFRISMTDFCRISLTFCY